VILVRHALGEVLRRHRTEQGRTLRDVADAARVSLGYLSEIERGQKEPSSELLFAVCDALGVPLSAVLAETGEHVRARETATARRVTESINRPQRLVLGRPGSRGSQDSSGPSRTASGRPAIRRTTVGLATLPPTDLVSLPLVLPDPRLAVDLGPDSRVEVQLVTEHGAGRLRELADAAA
jgi:transcriptional regulator with XRE-family HTH domain